MFRLVQAQATASLRPPSAREQQFRCDRLYLGQASRDLPKSRRGRPLSLLRKDRTAGSIAKGHPASSYCGQGAGDEALGLRPEARISTVIALRNGTAHRLEGEERLARQIAIGAELGRYRHLGVVDEVERGKNRWKSRIRA